MNTIKVNTADNLGNLANIVNSPKNISKLQNLILNLSSTPDPVINMLNMAVNNSIKSINNSDIEYHNKATQAVDHCQLRPLDEISSEMCTPTPLPLPTTQCIQPAVTKSTYKECALFRYEAPAIIIKKIKRDGYYVFRNMISDTELDVCKKYFYDDKVNYNRLRDEFINPSMLKKVGSELQRKLVNIKYRASNNNNSSDAASFHRDLHIKNNEKRVNNFTILTYVDGGIMQLIPGSNRNQQIDFLQIKHYYDSVVEIKLAPGDVLIVEMATIHRGLFYKKQKERRLLQLFDTVFNEELDYFLKNVLHIPCRNNCSKTQSDMFIKLNKNKFVSNMINGASFFNTALGYSKLPMKYITSLEGVKYISPESNQPRVVIKDDTFQPNNLYATNFPVIDIPEHERSRYIFLSLMLNHIMTLILICIIIAIIVLTINLVFKD